MKSFVCNLSNADAYLQRSLTPVQEEAFLKHLDICGSCREHLEATATKDCQLSDFSELLGGTTGIGLHQARSIDDTAELPLAVQQVLESLKPTDHPTSMGRIDNFEILGVVGSGAMGVVLKARDASLDRIVALKVMSPSLAESGTARSRFEREAKAAAAVHHASVIAIHGVQTTARLPYLVMPYLKGISLQKRVDAQGPLSLPEVLRIGSQIASGLSAAHKKGVIHRDIKPSNIMLDEGTDTAVITDFGLARIVDDATMTRTGVISGTPEFMSPEQARGDAMDSQSDMFSLGSLLYMLCTGRPPFRAETAFGVLRRITDDSPRPIRELNPDIPIWMCRIVEDLQQKSPRDRPTSAETEATLDACLAHVYAPDQAELPEKYLATTPQPSRIRFFLAGVLTMIATLSLFALMFLSDDKQTEKTPDVMPTKIATATGETQRIYKTINLDFPDPKHPGKLIVDINRGFVEVSAHDKPQVVIEVLYPPKWGEESTTKTLSKQFSPQFDLDTKEADNSIKLDTYNQNYPLNLRIKVPKKTDLDLDTYLDGYLTATGITGTVRARSEHCDISLHRINGSAQAYSRNGAIDVSFRKLSDDAQLDFESYNGSINLSFPKDASLTAAISAGRGTYSSTFDIGAPSKATLSLPWIRKLSQTEYSVGTINAGGIPLRIECAKGQISLREFDR